MTDEKNDNTENVMIDIGNMDLKNKVTVSSATIDMDKIEKAESIIANMASSYISWAMEDIKRLQEAYKTLTQNINNYEPHLKQVFEIAHDMKGQGGSFNYQLVTDIFNYLCRFIERIKSTPTQKLLDVIKLHIDAVDIILTNQITGDGGLKGERILEGLEATLQKYTPDLVEAFHQHKDAEKLHEQEKIAEFEAEHSIMSQDKKNF